MAHTFDPSQRQADLEFKTSVVYRGRSRTARARLEKVRARVFVCVCAQKLLILPTRHGHDFQKKNLFLNLKKVPSK